MKFVSTVWFVLLVIVCVNCGSTSTATSPFTKQVEVLGLHVYATNTTEDDKLLHVAAVLAEYIDNNEDGVPDNPKIMKALIEGKGAIVTTDTEEDAQRIRREGLKRPRGQEIEGEYAHLNAKARGVFDVSLEEVLHQVTDIDGEVHILKFSAECPAPKWQMRWIWQEEGVIWIHRNSTLKTPGIPITTTTRRAITTVSFRNIFTGGLRRYWADRVCITDCLQYALRYYLVSQYPVKSY
jgi:hypothetical protein